MLSYLYTKTILYKHFTNRPFLILHSPFMIITVDEVNNKKKLLYKTKGDYENEIEKVYCNGSSSLNGSWTGNWMWWIKF